MFVSQLKEGKPLTVTDPNMTRFLMSLEDSVDLVLYAFEHGQQGDIFVQKAPASTVADLAQALKEIFGSREQARIIGTRHGEKLYESLISREEMAHAQDMGGYYRIPADNRDLNYAKYFSEGEEKISHLDDYTSHNTERLNVEQVKVAVAETGFYSRKNYMLKVMTIVGTRPELIKMSRVIAELDRHMQHILVHTGQNYDYELNQIFFEDLGIRKPDHFLEAVGENAAQTIARVIEKSDAVMEQEQAGCSHAVRRHQFMSGGYRGKTSQNSGIPYGSGKPLLRSARAGRTKPQGAGSFVRH